MARTCAFPGCTVDISDKPSNTVWCSPCRLKMEKSRQARRYGKEGRKAVDPFLRERAVSNVVTGGPERAPVKKCGHCCDMPWARCPERYNTKSGPSCSREPVVVGGKCRGCGLTYESEPPPAPTEVLSSNARMAENFGKMFGGEAVARDGNRRR